MAHTIYDTERELHDALVEYIEATYHIADEGLIEQRRALLGLPGVIHQEAYIESTPRYLSANSFESLNGVNSAAIELFKILAEPINGRNLIYDPPYLHQASAIESVLGPNAQSVVVMTGTGSGKTESFLLPILGKLSIEAQSDPLSFKEQGMRALVLYPMNALVNDQLGRLRAFFGDDRLKSKFEGWANRVPTFARYTSRTPYAGIRTSSKDSAKLRPIRKFYIDLLQKERNGTDAEKVSARNLIGKLREKGKWPAKPDLEKWFGHDKTHWINGDTKEFQRGVTLPGDSELITRHEVQERVPDLLVTNYSMLEYMMMRPIERDIFDQTKQRLKKTNDSFLVILDEAHLYRGAAGAEVGNLLRRLRDRLGIPIDRFQVVCATASFSSPEKAKPFASKLTGIPEERFVVVEGKYKERDHPKKGTKEDADAFSGINLDLVYETDGKKRWSSLQELFSKLGVDMKESIEATLFHGLKDYGPLAELVNNTMGRALPAAQLGSLLFSGVDEGTAKLAASNLAALASMAKESPESASLLPCRVHTFHRGLRGLWVCMDKHCTELPAGTNRIVGKMYGQPREECDCGSRVLELFTCRLCGSAYARGYVDNTLEPEMIWAEPGVQLETSRGATEQLQPIDILLEDPEVLAHPDEPDDWDIEIFNYDLDTGQRNPSTIGDKRLRKLYLKASRRETKKKQTEDDEVLGQDILFNNGLFQPCAVCHEHGMLGKSPVQDHETKGDQPFQVLVKQQLIVQPPGSQPASPFAPLRGRKVLAFSDSRQVAARLAPTLQTFTNRDCLRLLMYRGLQKLKSSSGFVDSLHDCYVATLIAAAELEVRLRPELTINEAFHLEQVQEYVGPGKNPTTAELAQLFIDYRGHAPEAFANDIYETLRNRTRGFEALAIGSIVERADRRSKILALVNIPNVAENADSKLALARAWIRCWHRFGFTLAEPNIGNVRGSKGEFKRSMGRILSKSEYATFKKNWVPELNKLFAVHMGGNLWRLNGGTLTLEFGGDWIRCRRCKSIHRPIPGIAVCQDCGDKKVAPLDPTNDSAFKARKGFYRNAVLHPTESPITIIAAEHTAQLNSSSGDDIFSKAESNELLFQDIELPPESDALPPTAVDVLSSTTTMEVGIDLGQLSAVALRNMPPARSNYQQRAGRAGRRASTIATVLAFGGTDTHDEHYFANPAEMISGRVVDPKLSLDKIEISRRHVCAFLLQQYHAARIFDSSHRGDLFSVLGNVTDFRESGVLNLKDFAKWLGENKPELASRLDGWLPSELPSPAREELLANFDREVVDVIRLAVADYTLPPSKPSKKKKAEETEEPQVTEDLQELGEAQATERVDRSKLLDWLLYKAVLPRYAFPTDVAKFHIFDFGKSQEANWPVLKLEPSQGLAVALSQYAPGKQVWVAGKCYRSGALYTSQRGGLKAAWDAAQLFLECSKCGYSSIKNIGGEFEAKKQYDCPACQSDKSVGPVRKWMRPPGFAHIYDEPEETSPDDVPETSYATRAQLKIESPDASSWRRLETELSSILYLAEPQRLFVSNTGPKSQGYAYCVVCGKIETDTTHNGYLAHEHTKPYPDKERSCKGYLTSNLVLGMDFPTDVALFSLRVRSPFLLSPLSSVTKIALRTVSEALSRAATLELELEPGEIMAEFRPALTAAGVLGEEAEVFLYDTLPGGAGFSIDAAGKGVTLFKKALKLMEECPGSCDSSCYQCLRTFRNRMDHGSLDRYVGASLIQYLLTGSSHYGSKRIETSIKRLQSVLLRTRLNGVNVVCDEIIAADGHDVKIPIQLIRPDGKSLVVCLSNPLTDGTPVDEKIATYLTRQNREAEIVNELLVRKNIAAVISQIKASLAAI